MEFVVGIEIKLSNNHTLNGVPLTDICDELKGRYPKDFKFTGWHPHCRCHVVTALKTEEEMAEDTKKILNGEAPDTPSVNEVRDVPPAFRDWIQNNVARIVKASSLPYFMYDNPQYVSDAFHALQPSTRIAKQMVWTDVFEYAERYRGRTPKIDALLNVLDDGNYRTDIERAMLINRLKQECASVSYADLEKWGAVDEGFILSHIQRNHQIQPQVAYNDAQGNLRLTEKVQRDC